MVDLIIQGEPASKANSRKAVLIGGMPRFIKSAKALAYEKAVRCQFIPLSPLMDGDLRFTARVWYASRRPDLDISLILDCLQGIVYGNDRQVKEIHAYWWLDRENPRAYITIEEIAPIVED